MFLPPFSFLIIPIVPPTIHENKILGCNQVVVNLIVESLSFTSIKDQDFRLVLGFEVGTDLHRRMAP